MQDIGTLRILPAFPLFCMLGGYIWVLVQYFTLFWPRSLLWILFSFLGWFIPSLVLLKDSKRFLIVLWKISLSCFSSSLCMISCRLYRCLCCYEERKTIFIYLEIELEAISVRSACVMKTKTTPFKNEPKQSLKAFYFFFPLSSCRKAW